MADITDKEVLERLAGDAFIQAIDEGDGWSYELRGTVIPIPSSQLNRLMNAGLIRSCNTAYRISDKGKKEYLRSTDELRKS